MSGLFNAPAHPAKGPPSRAPAPAGFQPRRAAAPARTPLTPARGRLAVNRPGDALEQEADRAAEAALAGGPLPALQPAATPGIQREDKGGVEQTEAEKYKAALKLAGEAFLATEAGQRLKQQAEEQGRAFVSSAEGIVITGVGVAGLLTGLIAANESLPFQPPAIPLDFIYPGLKGDILYEGPLREPTRAGLKLTFSSGLALTGAYTGSPATETRPRGHGGMLSLEIPLGRSEAAPAGPSEADRRRAETARMAREQQAFRRSLMTPEERVAEERMALAALTRLHGGDPLNPLRFNPARYSAPGLAPSSDYRLRWPTLQTRPRTVSLLPEQPFGDLRLRPPLLPAHSLLGNPGASAPERREEEQAPLQRKARSSAPDQAAASPRHAGPGPSGAPLDASTRHHMEARFGVDFGAVRIHADADAAAAADRLNAHAFTQGGEIYFGAGRFDPRSAEGARLLAHELAHVVQQGAAAPAAPRATLEREARHAAGEVLRGRRPHLRHRHGGPEPLCYDPSETPGASVTTEETFEPDYLSGSSPYEMLREGRALAAQRGAILSRTVRSVVVTRRARVFDNAGTLLGTYDLRAGVRFPSGVLLVATDGTYQFGTSSGSSRTRPIGFDGSAVEGEEFYSEGVVAFESLFVIPEGERSRVWAAGPKLLLVAGRLGSVSEAGGDGGGEREGEDRASGAEGSYGTEFTIEDADGRSYQFPALSAEIRGLDQQPVGGTGIYGMHLSYAEAASELVGQVAWGVLPVYYRWELWDISGAADAAAGEAAVRRGGLAEGDDAGRRVDRMEGAARGFERSAEDLAARPAEIEADRAEARREGRWSDVLANQLNEELLPLEAIARYGGNLVSSFSGIFSDDREREVPWQHEGTYVVRCIAVIDPASDPDEPMRAPSVATKVVTVRPIEAISREELDRAAADMAELELQLALLRQLPEDDPARGAIPQLEQQLEGRRLAASGRTLDLLAYQLEQARRDLEARRSESRVLLEAGLHDPRIYALEQQVRQLEDQLRLARERVQQINARSDAPARRVQAVLVSRITGQTYPLIFQLSEPFIEGERWHGLLSDVTTQDSTLYEGLAPLDERAPTAAATEAVWEAFERYARDANMGEGSLTVRLPAGGWFARLPEEQRERTLITRTRDGAAALARLEELGTAIALLGLVVTSPALGVAGGLLGASLATNRIVNRLQNGTFRWNDSQTIGDVIEILSFGASFAGQAAHAAGALRYVQDGEGFVLRLLGSGSRTIAHGAEAAELALDVLGEIHGQLETLNQLMVINDAVGAGTLTATEARQQRAQIIIEAIQSGTLSFNSRLRGAHAAETDADARRPRPEATPESAAADGAERGDALASPRRRTPAEELDAPGGAPASPTPAELARRATMQAALGEQATHVQAEPNPDLLGNTVEVVYRDGRLRVEYGPDATPRHIRYHQETVRQLRRYEGLMGAVRILALRVRRLLFGGSEYGDARFEAGLEVQKLSLILQELNALRRRVEERSQEFTREREGGYREDGDLPLDLDDTTTATVDAEIAAIQAQLDRHTRELETATGPGRGRIAMADTSSEPLREGDEGFYGPLAVHQSVEYEEGGGHRGRATRVSADVTIIETEIAAGQTTVRSNYQAGALQVADSMTAAERDQAIATATERLQAARAALDAADPDLDATERDRLEGEVASAQRALRDARTALPVGEGGFERLHALGPIVGHESPFGILWGSHTLNHYLQAHGIETHLANLRSTGQLPPEAVFHATVVVERALGTGDHAGHEFLQSISYRIAYEGPGDTARRPALRLEVTVDRPQDPESGFGLSVIDLIAGHVAHSEVSAREAIEGGPTAERPRRGRGDLDSEHVSSGAAMLEEGAALVTALRALSTPEGDFLARELREMLLSIRSADRLRRDDVANLRLHVESVLRVFPELRPRFARAFSSSTP